jgi:hypothetical protein
MFAPGERQNSVRFTRADIQLIADVFAMLDDWSKKSETHATSAAPHDPIARRGGA